MSFSGSRQRPEPVIFAGLFNTLPAWLIAFGPGRECTPGRVHDEVEHQNRPLALPRPSSVAESASGMPG
jgi:hypothetical protein